MRKFVGLRSQMYSYLKYDGSGGKNSKLRKNVCNKARTQIWRWQKFSRSEAIWKSVVIMWYFIKSYDSHLSHWAYTIVVCSVFNII